ncbi:hypothetical protein ACL6C3_16835 [Capilliphycus salinus ALCB114379]|uniref:hypothetical protein n=1 Tax=Capilliphycus salinus TaxID=2768948 RepID=UPI0039A62A6A
MSLSDEELIALLSTQSTEAVISQSTVYPPYIREDIDLYTYLGLSNEDIVTITVHGFGFSPSGTSVNIDGFFSFNESDVVNNQIFNVKVKSFIEIELTLLIRQYGLKKITVTTPNGSSEQWGDKFLRIIEPIQTIGVNGWLDFRSYQPQNVVTTANYTQPDKTFSNSGLLQNSSGLTRSSTAYNNFQAIFTNLQIPVNSPFKLEFILQFWSGSYVVSGGFGTIDADWTKNIKSNATALFSLENRAWSSSYYASRNGAYYNKQFVTGNNWNNSYIHIAIDYYPADKVEIVAYSRASLSYDWSQIGTGEFICNFKQLNPDTGVKGGAYSASDNKLCPYIEIASSSSLSYIVAMKLY